MSIIASDRLNFWVRNEIRCFPIDKSPEQKSQFCCCLNGWKKSELFSSFDAKDEEYSLHMYGTYAWWTKSDLNRQQARFKSRCSTALSYWPMMQIAICDRADRIWTCDLRSWTGALTELCYSPTHIKAQRTSFNHSIGSFPIALRRSDQVFYK